MVPLLKPYMPPVDELDGVLHSGQLTYGKYAEDFERKLREYFNTPFLLITNSFNTAISVAVTTLGLKQNDCIISSPMACLASTQPYLSGGLRVCWADVDPNTGTLSPDSVRAQINSSVKAIVHNHFCGYPGYIDEINKLGEEYGIPVIDDGIECFGSEYKGKKIGNCGTDVSVFALTAVRFCNTVDGGIVIFKDKNLFDKALLVRDCGIERSRFRDEIGEINPDCNIDVMGYSATMSNVNGYIGLKQMDYVEDLINCHRNQSKKWKEYILNETSYKIIERKECNPNYWVFGLLAEKKREAIIKFRNMGYQASGVHMRNDIYSVFGRQDVELPGVDEFYNHFLALPCGWWME